MNPKDKALQLALIFCSPADVFKPNCASLRNAILCCEEIIKEYNSFVLDCIDTNRVDYWEEVLYYLKNT